MSIADHLLIRGSFSEENHTTKPIAVTVRASVPDPVHVHRRIESPLTNLTVRPTLSLFNFVAQFTQTNTDFNKYKKALHVKFRNRLFAADISSPATLHSIGVRNNDHIDLVSISNERTALANEGFMLSYWSAVPLILGLSFLASALSSSFDLYLRVAFLLIGSAAAVPSLLCFLIGLAEVFPSAFSVAFVNKWWFGRCCCCLCCGRDSDALLDSDDPLLYPADPNDPLLLSDVSLSA